MWLRLAPTPEIEVALEPEIKPYSVAACAFTTRGAAQKIKTRKEPENRFIFATVFTSDHSAGREVYSRSDRSAIE
jgi:hypothetical protein